MKSKTKARIIVLMAIGILFALSPIITTIHSFIKSISIASLEYSDNINLENKNLQISAVSGKIHISNNSDWVDFKNAGFCTGQGTSSEPYVIEDLVIGGKGSGSCILIENSNVYFRIENCTLFNSGSGLYNAGIKLSSVLNGQLINNDCSNNNGVGIGLLQSQNITIVGNIVNNNNMFGLFLEVSHNNNISENTLNANSDAIYLGLSNKNTILNNSAFNNDWRGIYLSSSSNNNNIMKNDVSYNGDNGIDIYDSHDIKVVGNIANHNGGNGIFVWQSNNNIFSGNSANYNTLAGLYLGESNNSFILGNTLIENDECIVEEDCEGNIFNNNNCGGGTIPGYYLFFLLGILSVTAIIISKKVKKYKTN